MSYSMVSAPSDLFGRNSTIHSHRFGASTVEPRRDSDSRSPMSEPRSPLFRPSLVAELPPHFASLYNSPYAAAAVAAAVAGQGAAGSVSPSAYSPYGRTPATPMFYPGMVNTDAWRRSPYLSQLDFCWPQGLRSLEAMMGPRTKAPREATSILKSWLSDHKDNPYPTKNEKMTLSLVTHMTLTQVSTWFANARRRIKKENKMTWTPKTRCGERDGSSSNDDESEKDFHRRPLSPFKTHSINDVLPRREYDVEKRLICTNLATPSRSLSPDTSRKMASAHQLFSSFPKLPIPYYNASLQGAFKQHITPKQMENSHVQNKHFPVTANKKTTAEGKRTSSPSLVRKSDVDKAKETITESTKKSEFSEHDAQQPFVRLTHNDEPKKHSQEQNTKVKQEAVKVSDTSDDDDIQSPFPTPKSPASDNLSREDKTQSDISMPNGTQSKDQISPSKFQPITTTSDMMTNPVMNEKQDPLSCWIRDFQQLVTSGQELKAKQALATALAVAAKAGAYSGRNSQRNTSYFQPLQSDTYKPAYSERMTSIVAEDSVQFQNDEQKLCRKRKHDNDVMIVSPKMRREQESPSVVSNLTSKSPTSPQENIPMNLTKASPTRVWNRENLTSDDARIEV